MSNPNFFFETLIPNLYGQILGSNQPIDFSGAPYVLLPPTTTPYMGTWLPSTVYDVGDIVQWEGASFQALVYHTSGSDAVRSFATDYAAGKWRQLSQRSTVFNVRDYGAIGNNGTNDTAAIQAAITAAQAVNGIVYIPKGTYQLYSALTITAAITFIGDGPITTRFNIVGNHDGIQIANGASTAIEHLYVGNFSLLAASNLTSGAGIRVGKVSKSLFYNIAIDYTINTFAGRLYDGIVVNAAQQSWFDKIFIQATGRHGFVCANVSNHSIVDINLVNSQFLQCVGDCILLEASTGQSTTYDVEGIYIEGVTTFFGANPTGNALHINATASSCVQNIFVKDTVLDSCEYGVYIEGAGRLSQISFQDTWFSFNDTQNGYFGPNVTDLVIDGGHCVLAQNDGFFLDGVQGGRIQNVSFENNGRASLGTYYGLNLGDSDNVMVQGNKFYNSANFSQRQSGIKSTSGSSGCIIKNNYITVPGYTTLALQGTGHKVISNEGYNPQGIVAGIGGSTPYTYTAGFTPATLYVRGGSIDSIAKSSTVLFTSTDKQVELDPGDSAVITYTPGDNAISFTDSDNVVTVPNNAVFQGLSAFTIEAFIVLNNQPTNAAYIFYYYNGGNTGYRLAVAGGTVSLQGSAGNGSTFQGGASGGTIPTGTRSHVAMSWDGSNIRSFVNGTLVQTSALSGGNTGNPGVDLFIANNAAAAGNRAFPGTIDEIRISSVARYTATFTPPDRPFTTDASTIEIFHENEGTGTTTTGTGGNVGTFAGSTSPTWVTGLASIPTIIVDNR